MFDAQRKGHLVLENKEENVDQTPETQVVDDQTVTNSDDAAVATEVTEVTEEAVNPRGKQKIKIALSPLTAFVVLLGAILGSTGGAAVGILALDGAAKRISNSGEIVVNNPQELSWATAASTKAAPSTVALLVSSPQTVTTGSGFVISEDGHIVTSAHVIHHKLSTPEETVIQVRTWEGEVYPAEIVGVDLDTDVGVIRIAGDYTNGELRPATWGDSSKLNTGDPVIALGSPFDLLNTVTSGIVSNPDRVIQLTSQRDEQKVSAQMEFFGEDIAVEDAITVRVIQADVPINPGNSGGPLVNADGDIVGLVAAIAGAEYSTGLSFSIQGNNVRRIAEDIIATGGPSNGLLGIIVTSAFPEWVPEDYSGPSFLVGAEVVELASGGAGEKAGLQVEDVIVEADGLPISTTVGLSSYISSLPPGSQVELTVLRDGVETALTATLGQRITS